MWNETKQDTGMNGEIVDSLFCLFDESVPEEFPGQVLDSAVGLFKGLIDRDRSDGDRGVADDPFPGSMNILSG